jgi:hypothetical protein
VRYAFTPRRLATALVVLLAACSSPTAPAEDEQELIGLVEGIALSASGAPLDSVRILPIGAGDEAIYSFVQALTGEDGRFSVLVSRMGAVHDTVPLSLTVNVIATAFKGFDEKPGGPFPTKHVTVRVAFVAPGTEPPPARLEIRF